MNTSELLQAHTEHLKLFRSESFLWRKEKVRGFDHVYYGLPMEFDDSLPTLQIYIGPSGSGKTTITSQFESLMKHYGEREFKRVITATTRAPRDGEVHGIDYVFLNNPIKSGETDLEYQNRIQIEEKLAECDVHHGNAYGIPKANLDKFFSDGQGYMILENAGAINMRDNVLKGKANVPIIFVVPDNGAQLLDSIMERENPEKRITRSVEELHGESKISNFYFHSDRKTALEDLQYEAFRFAVAIK